MDKTLLKKAKEAADNSRIILEDMKKNRGNYSALDLAWRNIDMNMVVIETIHMTLLALLSGEPEEESPPEVEEVTKNEQSEKSKKPATKKKTTEKAESNIRPSITKVVDKSKK